MMAAWHPGIASLGGIDERPQDIAACGLDSLGTGRTGTAPSLPEHLARLGPAVSGDRRHGGQGVLRAVRNVHKEIAPAVLGTGLDDQAALDAALVALDGTPNKARLGANAVL